MTENNVVQRLLLFIIAIPLIIGGIFFLPYQSHLFINLAIVITNFLASKELINMLENRGIKLKSKLLPYLSIILPLVSYLIVRFNLSSNIFSITFTSLIILVLMFSVSTKKSEIDFSNNISFITSSFLVILYPGYFFSYMIRFSEFQNSSIIICFFILIIIMNDSGAWVLGVLFGKNNRGVVKVSKNKSVMGFIGGTISSVIMFFIAKYNIPELASMPIYMCILLSLIIAFVTIIGDLVESAMKRSCNVKDSGNIVLGRGGLLDSVDSLLLAAPIFYYIVKTYAEKGI